MDRASLSIHLCWSCHTHTNRPFFYKSQAGSYWYPLHVCFQPFILASSKSLPWACTCQFMYLVSPLYSILIPPCHSAWLGLHVHPKDCVMDSNAQYSKDYQNLCLWLARERLLLVSVEKMCDVLVDTHACAGVTATLTYDLRSLVSRLSPALCTTLHLIQEWASWNPMLCVYCHRVEGALISQGRVHTCTYM